MQHLLKQVLKMKLPTTPTRIFSGGVRCFSTDTAAPTTESSAEGAQTVNKEFLFQQLYDLGSNVGRVSDVIHRTIRTGKLVTKTLLILCLKDLRKFGRYQQCLEILDWMEKGKYEFSGREFALRIGILHKVKGIAEVEKYFDGIPSDLKTNFVYGSLLNCYCSDLATDKALALFKTMDEMGYASHVLSFNNLLYLYVKVGQLKKVPELIADMKHRNIPLNSHTYSAWIQSYRLLGDHEGVERVFQEAEDQASVKDVWVIHTTVASAFIDFNLPEKAITYLQKMENILDNAENPNRVAYHHLISLYGNAGKLEGVIRAWDKLEAKFKGVYNKISCLSLLQALSKLDEIKAMEKYFREWQSNCKNYDDKIPAVLIGAYLKHDMLKEAEVLLKDVTEKAKLVRMPHIKFMNYYFEKGQADCAMKHMEIAVDFKWKPTAEKLDPCFQHFKAEKDVDGLERFCRLLKRAKALDAKAYKWLLQTYVDTEKTAPNMRERMAEDGIEITPEMEELLEKVCPN